MVGHGDLTSSQRAVDDGACASFEREKELSGTMSRIERSTVDPEWKLFLRTERSDQHLAESNFALHFTGRVRDMKPDLTS